VRRGFFGAEDFGAGVFFAGGEDLLFGVAAPEFDLPGVEFVAGLKTKKAQQGTQMSTGES
jgi:hypothetical protein